MQTKPFRCWYTTPTRKRSASMIASHVLQHAWAFRVASIMYVPSFVHGDAMVVGLNGLPIVLSQRTSTWLMGTIGHCGMASDENKDEWPRPSSIGYAGRSHHHLTVGAFFLCYTPAGRQGAHFPEGTKNGPVSSGCGLLTRTTAHYCGVGPSTLARSWRRWL